MSDSASLSYVDDIVRKISDNDPSLAVVELNSQHLGDADCARIAEALRGNTTVKKLWLHCNIIGDAGCVEIAEALKHNTSIVHLGLHDNSIGSIGASALAEALRGNTTVTELQLCCNIGDAGASALAEALKHNSSIIYLWLGKNDIGDIGASALADMLKTNTTIADLSLADNAIGDVGASALAEALKRNTSVTALNLDSNCIGLDGNHIGNVGASALAEALLTNTSITWLPLDRKNSIIGTDLKKKIKALVRISAKVDSREEARRSKIKLRIEWMLDAEDDDGGAGEAEAAVALALDEVGSFPEASHRRELFRTLLGSPGRGADVAASVETVPRGRALYRYAAECDAAPAVLVNVLRAHPSLCGTCRDVERKIYPFMLLATMPDAGVGAVVESLLQCPNLVETGISNE